ncbi:kinesin-like protein KIN-14N [Asparagus officinalis]|uniref:kinesin-like protein KIN-14N n=1 Tax=Asparagus officinalis TaxID=4686 RepID=UPI00098DFE65|nr:kinesin-like protein KIN-14N [Asparagus officinalis]
MKGKNKNDYKGKSEQMSEYIKKLRTCIRWLIEREDGNLMEQEKIRSMLESEEKRHADNEAKLKGDIEGLKAKIEELQGQHESMQELFRKEEFDKNAAIKSYEEEKAVRIAAEKTRDALSEELVKAGQEAKHLDDQIKVHEATNKRLQEYNTSLQQYNCTLQAEVAKNSETISKLNEEKNSMMGTMTSLRNNMTSMKTQLDNYRSLQHEAGKQKEDLKREVDSLRSDLQLIRDDRDTQLAQVQSLVVEIANLRELTGKSATEVEKTMTKANALEETCSSQRERIQALLQELAIAKEKLKMADLTATQTMTEYEEQKRTTKDLENRLADAEYQIAEAEKLRKELHNTILELKGNIRVFCRVRPALSDSDSSSSDGVVVSYPLSTELRGRGIDLMHNAKTIPFAFDKVFNHEASQEDVFVEISQLVQSALDGYKVCIFAYGQTGSGKTYTMMGMTDSPQQKGLIPRSLEQIFQTSQSKLSQGWKYKMQASMLEIYNETIRDLLSSNRSGGLDVKHDTNGNTCVPGLTVVDVCSINEVSYLLQQAAQSRSVGKTHMNEESSRSHFVFTLRISGVNENTDQQVQGILNLIDLAGSERLSRSGATGDRLKETQAINKSLSSLRDVIFAIANRKEHVPYRNSKLTHLLQSCLGGESKTLMFVNISPEASSSGESFCSLQFATGVNSCEIGIARRQTQMRSSDSRLSYG